MIDKQITLFKDNMEYLQHDKILDINSLWTINFMFIL